LISKRDLINRLKEREQNNLTQKQLDELQVTKSEVAEHSKNWEFSYTAPIKDYPTQAEIQAERVYKFTHILKEKKN
jgi:hypothetical protein